MKLSELITRLLEFQQATTGEDPVVKVSDWSEQWRSPTVLTNIELCRFDKDEPQIVLIEDV